MKEIGIKGILECLDKGMSREEIAEHYGITLSELKKHFQHPKLKGKKAKKQLSSVLVDDTVEEITQASDTEEIREVPESEATEEVVEGDVPAWSN